MTERLNSLPVNAALVLKRERLPDTRRSLTHKFEVGQHEGYITVGFYDDGRPGEVFVKIAKHGSTISGLLDTIAVLTSMALQYGVQSKLLPGNSSTRGLNRRAGRETLSFAVSILLSITCFAGSALSARKNIALSRPTKLNQILRSKNRSEGSNLVAALPTVFSHTVGSLTDRNVVRCAQGAKGGAERTASSNGRLMHEPELGWVSGN